MMIAKVSRIRIAKSITVDKGAAAANMSTTSKAAVRGRQGKKYPEFFCYQSNDNTVFQHTNSTQSSTTSHILMKVNWKKGRADRV
ncbi:hypothetical protein DFP92_1334 [Yoonia sediminilitoris]|uniref:Uncharacterized protein n=1 Tax=Yoonia sediminilitoris TaxID=1286148 RepID=A0A2T6K1H5_9RHOB|nr:hypothetical protein C8N45_1334 [Yoonia sediminilitoris]RCW89450.1 hypothetical protein DFP92_1334 [Yoonia sediminilitoris]